MKMVRIYPIKAPIKRGCRRSPWQAVACLTTWLGGASGQRVALACGRLEPSRDVVVMPRLLNFIVAICLIVIGLIGLFGAGGLRLI